MPHPLPQASAYLEANPTMPKWFEEMVNRILAMTEAQIAAKWACDWYHPNRCDCWKGVR